MHLCTPRSIIIAYFFLFISFVTLFETCDCHELKHLTSEFPLVFPNEFPLVFPNEFPLVFPNEFPLVFPNEFPVVFPNEFPLVFPNEFPLVFPNEFPLVFPNEFQFPLISCSSFFSLNPHTHIVRHTSLSATILFLTFFYFEYIYALRCRYVESADDCATALTCKYS